jgi:hypothetical protein
MEWSKRAFAGLGWGLSKHSWVRVAYVALGTAAAGAPVHAAGDGGCHAINNGALNIELEADGRATRAVTLKAGDTLTFNFEAPAGLLGSLELLKGPGAPRSLLVGPSGTNVSFVAAKAAAFDFEFSKTGAEAATFAASCTPAGSARAGRPAAAARRSAKLFGGTANDAGTLEMAELAGVVLDTGVPAPNRGDPAAPLTASAPVNAGALKRAAAVDVKMQWRGEHYQAGGPGGIEPGNAASGVEAAFNYKVLPEIMVGALAQVDQPNETMSGVPHAVAEQGWMAGPVANVKLAPGLTFDARAAWGVAEGATDELSARTANIPRRTVSAKLANTQSFGPWRISPSVSVNHYEAASAPALATIHDHAIPYAADAYGRVDVGPEFAYRIELDKSGFIEPRAALGTFWDFDSLSRLAPGAAGHNDMRLKAEAGVTIGATDGTKLQAGGTVEEGEPGAANVWSGRLQLSVPMK